jgi:hypothetical protein
MIKLFFLSIGLILFVIGVVKVELYLIFKSKENIKEAIKAYKDLKESREVLKEFLK